MRNCYIDFSLPKSKLRCPGQHETVRILKDFAKDVDCFLCRFIMSRLYDTIEPSVIDEQMLNEAVEEQGPKGEAGRIAKQEGIDFGDVLYLRLDFKSKILEYSFSENCQFFRPI